jgi:ArsR family transcriptional regulator, lead/cadmium/zinc/bismuth-responsive transcriptional repressor
MIDNRSDFETCDCDIIHDDIVSNARKAMLKDDIYYGLAEFFKVFSDVTRIKILNALILSEMCVCDIGALLNMNHSAVSHQLRVLKQTRLVKYRKEGKVVYYSLNDDHIKEIFDKGLIHVNEK